MHSTVTSSTRWRDTTNLAAGQFPFAMKKGEQLVLPRPVVVSRLRPKRHLCAEEFTYLRARTNAAGKDDADQCAAGRGLLRQQALEAAPIRPSIHTSRTWWTSFAREVLELVRLGCTYIQIDSPQYTALLDSEIREGYRARGNDPDRLLDLSIEMDNAIISGFTGVTFGLHLCRGNNQSKFYAQGDYGPITRVFTNTRFHRFLLEYDDKRSGGFEPLRRVPDDRIVVLGLVSTKHAALESAESLKARINEASAIIPRERLALSPQCGFASTLEGNLLTEADEEAKLKLVATTAREVWGT